MSIEKSCPKCDIKHSKTGAFCSRTCANSRCPRPKEFKEIVSRKLKLLQSQQFKPLYIRIKFSPITGEVLSKYKDTSFWANPSKSHFIRKLAKMV